MFDTPAAFIIIGALVLWLVIDGLIVWFGGALHDARQKRAFNRHTNQALRVVDQRPIDWEVTSR